MARRQQLYPEPHHRPDAVADKHWRISRASAELVEQIVERRRQAGIRQTEADAVDEAIRYWAGNSVSDAVYTIINMERARILVQEGREVSRGELIERAVRAVYGPKEAPAGE